MTDRYHCHACGEEWDVHPFRQVPCPDCGAAVGVRCKRPSGHDAAEEPSDVLLLVEAANDDGDMGRARH